MTAATLSPRDATRDLRRRLSARFGKTTNAVRMPQHAVLFEVPIDGVRRWTVTDQHTGEPREAKQRHRQRIDAVAVGLWANTDHLVHGFEIKASRADLVKELRDPQKSEAARLVCDRWWLVLADRKLLGDEQPPDGWGVLAACGRGLRVVTQPAEREGKPDPRFVAALIQSAMTGRGAVGYGLGVIDGYQRGHKRGKRDGYHEGRYDERAEMWRNTP